MITSLTSIVKTTVLVSDISKFNLVNEARACVEDSRLPKDVIVAIETIAIVK